MRLLKQACTVLHHQLCHPRRPISDRLPERAWPVPGVTQSPIAFFTIICNWWKAVSETCRGRRTMWATSCVHAALNIRIGASYLFIRKQAGIWTTAFQQQLRWNDDAWEVLRGIGEYPPLNWGCSLPSNYQQAGTLQQRCMSINETSVWLWIEKNDSMKKQDHPALHDKWSDNINF